VSNSCNLLTDNSLCHVRKVTIYTFVFSFFLLVTLLLTGCGSSSEEAAIAHEEAVATSVAMTIAAMPTQTLAPTNTPTQTATSTLIPTTTPTNTPTITLTPTASPSPTPTIEPTPTITPTLTAAQIKVNQLYGSIRNLRYYAQNLYEGLGGTNISYVACSRELRESVVTNYERVGSLSAFDDELLSERAIGARIGYDTARGAILSNPNIRKIYDNCVRWIEAGKPGGTSDWGGADFADAIYAADQAIKLADNALNN
jgi:hypothetical protein